MPALQGFVSKDGDDHWLLELWRDEQRVSLYFEDEGITFIRCKGPRIPTSVEDGIVATPQMWEALLEWLIQ